MSFLDIAEKHGTNFRESNMVIKQGKKNLPNTLPCNSLMFAADSKMNSRFHLVDLNVSLEAPRKLPSAILWEKCAICQKEIKGEEPVNPLKSTRLSTDDAYTSLARNLEGFARLGRLPEDVQLHLLKGNLTLEESLRKNRAVYHKSCALTFNKTKLDRLMATKRSCDQENIPPPSPVKTRKSLSLSPYEKDTCLFCSLGSSRVWPLSTLQEEGANAIYKCSVELRDSKMLTMCEGGIKNKMYHKKCYTNYLNRTRSQKLKSSESSTQSQAHGVVLARLISHMHEVREEATQPPAFKMSQLARIYSAEMEAMGETCDVHSTRLRERLLQECPELESTGKSGQDIFIAFRRDIDWSIRDSCRRDYDDEGYYLSRTAEIVRKDLFSESQTVGRSTPMSLKSLCRMILLGPALRSEEPEGEDFDQVVTSMADLLTYHAVKKVQGKTRRHNSQQETPTPVYVATKLYGETRKKDIIDIHHRIGLCISYDRLQTLLNQAAQKTSLRYLRQGVVSPMPVGSSRFVTGAVDNFDHNPSSTTAKSAFHGTAISIMQHPSNERPGELQFTAIANPDAMPEALSKRATKFDLPAEYAIVPVSFLDQKRARCPALPPCASTMSVEPLDMERGWLEQCRVDSCTPWAEYHSESDSRRPMGKDLLTNVSVLPLFHEKAQSMSMMEHAMRVLDKATEHLNPGQIRVITADQPLFALCKCVQWLVSDLSEEHFFVMFGAMHIELAALRVLGQWLNESGWVDALLESGVATEGRAKSMINVSHLTRTRYAHEVTAAALYRLQIAAFEAGVGDCDDPMTFNQWRQKRREESVQFRYWDITMEIELTVLLIVRSLRCADFDLYVAALRKLVPWFFALNHTHYSRWLPVHIRDLENVHLTHPTLYHEFKQGKFVGRLSERIFSGLALDQCHEQQNARLKGDGGMIGLTENPAALRKWMLATPELVRMNTEFEENLDRTQTADHKHHRSTKAAREAFLKHVSSMESAMKEKGNPFLDDGKVLYNIYTESVCHSDVATFVTKVESLGEEQYTKFRTERLESNAVDLQDTIKENKLRLFSTTQKQVPKVKEQIKSLKDDCNLWSRLYVATSSNRPSELDEFFSHENQPYPPSLSLHGSLRSTDKSDLCKCLLDLTKVDTAPTCPPVDAKILDGAAIVHSMLKPGTSEYFRDYVNNVFITFLNNESKNVKRVDIVWDRYFKDSLKGLTREKRGDSDNNKLHKVTLATKMPSVWEKFLRQSDNKTGLFRMLSESLKNVHIEGVSLYSTLEESVVASPPRTDLQGLAPCNHEEADTRLFVHVADAAKQGFGRVLIRTSDTDVVVIAVSSVHRLPLVRELWIHLKAGKKNSFLPVHEMASSLGPAKSLALIGLHAFTGNDNVSSFYSIGKAKALSAFERLEESVEAFIALCHGNVQEARNALINFVIALYSRSKMYPSLVACRRELFSTFDRPIESIPPTEDSLMLHMKRAAFMAMTWFQSLQPWQELPSPSDFGWKRSADGTWEVVWRLLDVAAKSCVALVRCKCKTVCRGNCSCKKDPRGLQCTELCRCPCDKSPK
ncbi:Phosphoglycerate kinase [Frankliniella fusca]|uniref:Phosphoglycerate kinase n=1 Tax=Frankliniella fusca TaxID=407009 RepID=A0AAE1LJ94_9NEOP|nr:Phosphoglycerate kinase [Frankliniella fusca]